ncbi:MAG: hypothetical protein CME31_07445 [Gimesia sp.]|jgi:hypothetical protein|uniref:Uncharacterized protein n=1 Tax=Gimesia maris TaxID=122 RepID=A0A3D3R6F9_9PLAN|nr:hypothetical protein [Gimesia sp.]HCO24339.1 hypothetical protein [Gimesia maris]|tara:strand:+ start:1525 stop:2076 length:552 start_codon:yes stop_codon:yes gene_type:complete
MQRIVGRKYTERRLFQTVLPTVITLTLVLLISQQVGAGEPEITVSADGPFPAREYGPGEDVYVGKVLVSGKTFHELNLNVPDLAEVRSLNTSRHDDQFNVGVTFVFPGKPGDHKVRVTARLLDECGNVLQIQSCICGDARNIPGNSYFGFSMAAARYNSETLRFKDCEHLPIHRVEVSLINVK